jgi:hypothetical protein
MPDYHALRLRKTCNPYLFSYSSMRDCLIRGRNNRCYGSVDKAPSCLNMVGMKRGPPRVRPTASVLTIDIPFTF